MTEAVRTSGRVRRASAWAAAAEETTVIAPKVKASTRGRPSRSSSATKHETPVENVEDWPSVQLNSSRLSIAAKLSISEDSLDGETYEYIESEGGDPLRSLVDFCIYHANTGATLSIEQVEQLIAESPENRHLIKVTGYAQQILPRKWRETLTSLLVTAPPVNLESTVTETSEASETPTNPRKRGRRAATDTQNLTETPVLDYDSLQVGMLIDGFCTRTNLWHTAKVLEIDEEQQRYRVHLQGSKPRIEQWIEKNSEMLLPHNASKIIVAQAASFAKGMRPWYSQKEVFKRTEEILGEPCPVLEKTLITLEGFEDWCVDLTYANPSLWIISTSGNWYCVAGVMCLGSGDSYGTPHPSYNNDFKTAQQKFQCAAHVAMATLDCFPRFLSFGSIMETVNMRVEPSVVNELLVLEYADFVLEQLRGIEPLPEWGGKIPSMSECSLVINLEKLAEQFHEAGGLYGLQTGQFDGPSARKRRAQYLEWFPSVHPSLNASGKKKRARITVQEDEMEGLDDVKHEFVDDSTTDVSLDVKAGRGRGRGKAGSAIKDAVVPSLPPLFEVNPESSIPKEECPDLLLACWLVLMNWHDTLHLPYLSLDDLRSILNESESCPRVLREVFVRLIVPVLRDRISQNQGLEHFSLNRITRQILTHKGLDPGDAFQDIALGTPKQGADENAALHKRDWYLPLFTPLPDIAVDASDVFGLAVDGVERMDYSLGESVAGLYRFLSNGDTWMEVTKQLCLEREKEFLDDSTTLSPSPALKAETVPVLLSHLSTILRRDSLVWCQDLLDELRTMVNTAAFEVPVDPELYGLTSYREVVTSPMDLSTLQARLISGWYDDVACDRFESTGLTVSQMVAKEPSVNQSTISNLGHGELMEFSVEDDVQLVDLNLRSPLRYRLGQLVDVWSPTFESWLEALVIGLMYEPHPRNSLPEDRIFCGYRVRFFTLSTAFEEDIFLDEERILAYRAATNDRRRKIPPNELLSRYPSLATVSEVLGTFDRDMETVEHDGEQLTRGAGFAGFLADASLLWQNCYKYYGSEESPLMDDMLGEGRALQEAFSSLLSERLFGGKVPSVQAIDVALDMCSARKKISPAVADENSEMDLDIPKTSGITDSPSYFLPAEVWKTGLSSHQSLRSLVSELQDSVQIGDISLQSLLVCHTHVPFLQLPVSLKTKLLHTLCLEFLSTSSVRDILSRQNVAASVSAAPWDVSSVTELMDLLTNHSTGSESPATSLDFGKSTSMVEAGSSTTQPVVPFSPSIVQNPAPVKEKSPKSAEEEVKATSTWLTSLVEHRPPPLGVDRYGNEYFTFRGDIEVPSIFSLVTLRSLNDVLKKEDSSDVLKSNGTEWRRYKSKDDLRTLLLWLDEKIPCEALLARNILLWVVNHRIVLSTEQIVDATANPEEDTKLEKSLSIRISRRPKESLVSAAKRRGKRSEADAAAELLVSARQADFAFQYKSLISVYSAPRITFCHAAMVHRETFFNAIGVSPSQGLCGMPALYYIIPVPLTATRASLGVGVKSAPQVRRVYVTSLLAGGLADSCGLKIGDRICFAQRQRVDSVPTLQSILQKVAATVTTTTSSVPSDSTDSSPSPVGEQLQTTLYLVIYRYSDPCTDPVFTDLVRRDQTLSRTMYESHMRAVSNLTSRLPPATLEASSIVQTLPLEAVYPSLRPVPWQQNSVLTALLRFAEKLNHPAATSPLWREHLYLESLLHIFSYWETLSKANMSFFVSLSGSSTSNTNPVVISDVVPDKTLCEEITQRLLSVVRTLLLDLEYDMCTYGTAMMPAWIQPENRIRLQWRTMVQSSNNFDQIAYAQSIFMGGIDWPTVERLCSPVTNKEKISSIFASAGVDSSIMPSDNQRVIYYGDGHSAIRRIDASDRDSPGTSALYQGGEYLFTKAGNLRNGLPRPQPRRRVIWGSTLSPVPGAVWDCTVRRTRLIDQAGLPFIQVTLSPNFVSHTNTDEKNLIPTTSWVLPFKIDLPKPSSRLFLDTETTPTWRNRRLQLRLRRVLDNLQSVLPCQPFAEPVSVQAYPDYTMIVSSPIDLSVITKRLEDGEYLSVDDFLNEFYLMRDNCVLYNGPADTRLVPLAQSIVAFVENETSIMRSVDLLISQQQKSGSSIDSPSPTAKMFTVCVPLLRGVPSFLVDVNKYSDSIRRINRFTADTFHVRIPLTTERGGVVRYATGLIVSTSPIAPNGAIPWNALEIEWVDPIEQLLPRRVNPWDVEVFVQLHY